MKKLLLILSLLCLAPFGAEAVYKSSTNSGGSSGGPTTNPVSVAQGGTGVTSLGPCLSNATGSLNTTNGAPRATVTTTTDTLLASDACEIVTYNNASGVTVTAPNSASTTGFGQGYYVTIKNIGAGAVVVTPTASTINGASTFSVPANTGCDIYTDGTNYQINPASCSALPISSANLPINGRYRTLGINIGCAGTTPTAGTTQPNYFTVPYAGTITGWAMASDISGSAVVDVWKLNGAIPTIANTIDASALPTLSSQQYVSSTTLTGWTTSVAVGDVFGYKLNSASTLTCIVLQLNITAN